MSKGRIAVSATASDSALGDFEDDYGNQFTITETQWLQRPRSRYRITMWRPQAQYLIARNDGQNPSEHGLWTRIDWMILHDMPPYRWAFCMSAYGVLSAAAAESTAVARRETPRTGCNGFPFSLMKRAR